MAQDTVHYDTAAYGQAHSHYEQYGQGGQGGQGGGAYPTGLMSKPPDSERVSKDHVTSTMVLMCCLVAFIAASTIMFSLVLVFGDSSVTGTEPPVSTNVPNLPAPDPKELLRTTSINLRTTPKNTVTPTIESTVPTTAGTPTASTLPPRPAMDEQPLVCTMGSRTSSEMMFPPDGLCDYIFFDSVEKDNRNPLALPTEWDTDLRIFINASYRYNTTEFGVGFGFDNVFTLYQQLRTASAPPLLPFWTNNIFHFGILDTATLNASQDDVSLALLFLQVLDMKVEIQRQRGNPSYIFFAGVAIDEDWINFYNHQFAYLYEPDLFIAQGHYFYGDNTFRDCRVMPPTLLARPPGVEETYQHDLDMAAGTLSNFSSLTLPITWALSVTMKGRWTMSLPFQTFDDFFSVCLQNTTTGSFGSYTEVCTNARFIQTLYSWEVDSVLAVNDAEPVLFAYDNEFGLCRKLCSVKAQHLDVRFGIAVYDLDYEDFTNSCGPLNKYGAFSRLHAIRVVINFYRTRFKRFSDLKPCQQLIS